MEEEQRLIINPSDMRIGLLLPEESCIFRKKFITHNTNQLLKQMFNIYSLSDDTYNGPLNIRATIGSKTVVMLGDYWLFSTHEQKELYSKVVPDLYLFLTQMDEQNLNYKFIEVMERHFLIRGKLTPEQERYDVKMELLTRIYPFENRLIGV